MSSDDAFLEAAAAIGRGIVAEAVWDDGQCSWIGATGAPTGPCEYRPLDATVYRGTAGVGLFLAQVAVATGDAGAKRTALGALRHAVTRAGSLPADREGFHAGPLGVAWAAAAAASFLDADELRDGARGVLAPTAPPASAARCPDVVLGAAGAALALLALAIELGEPALEARASEAGEALLAAATISRRGWSWATPGRRRPHALCGVSHGAGGIGWALVELFAATGDERFRAGAEGAFAYERSWLDPDSRTWPDLRVGGQAPPRAIASPSAGTWCHGEAGIALSRLRADALLCMDGGDLPAELGRAAIDRYAASGGWPCGMVGTTPALFRGLSGIGWFFLRLHDRTTPSPLLLPAAVDAAFART